MNFVMLGFKIFKAATRKVLTLVCTLHTKLIFALNGIKSKKIKAYGVPYVNISREGSVHIGDNFYIRTGTSRSEVGSTGSRIIVRGKGKLKIGNNVGMTNTTIFVDESITIGDNVMIGGGVQIFDTNFHSVDPSIRTSGKEVHSDIKTAPVNIGNNVFIGTNSIICKGVFIGENAMIAAGSVVIKNVGANEKHGGNPAGKI